MHRSLALARECAHGLVRECEFGLSFIRSRASRESSVNDSPVKLLRNFTSGWVREVRAEKCARGKRKVNPPRKIPPTSKDYLSFRGWLAFSSHFLSLNISHRRGSHQLRSQRSKSASEKQKSRLLENTLFYCTPDPTNSGLVIVEAGLSNAKFEFA